MGAVCVYLCDVDLIRVHGRKLGYRLDVCEVLVSGVGTASWLRGC